MSRQDSRLGGLGTLVSESRRSLLYLDPAFPDRTLVLHGACPARFDAQTPILFVHHGVLRNGQAYRDYWLAHVERIGVLVIAVEFPETSFPEYLWYNFGNTHAKDGAPNPRSAWTFGIVERLFLRMRTLGITTTARYGLFGHSAGGQFVHRMLSFGWREHVAVAVSANAGTYAMPDLETAWPFGLGQTETDTAMLAALLRFPMTVMAGTEDTKSSGRFFPKGPRSMRQGANRYERAHAYVRAGHAAAASLGTACAWRVIDVAGIGHDGAGMSDAAAPVIAEAFKAGEG